MSNGASDDNPRPVWASRKSAVKIEVRRCMSIQSVRCQRAGNCGLSGLVEILIASSVFSEIVERLAESKIQLRTVHLWQRVERE